MVVSGECEWLEDRRPDARTRAARRAMQRSTPPCGRTGAIAFLLLRPIPRGFGKKDPTM
jgi:hypothetical protein